MTPLRPRVLARLLFTSAVVIACASAARPASAGEIQVASGPGVYGSSWRGDSSFGQALRVGYRFGDLIAIDTLGRLGYGTVDERIITYLSLGGTLYGRIWKLRPYVRLAIVHQHEEPAPGVREDPFGTVFGVGDGIRHRGGFGSSLGLDLPIHRAKNLELVVGVDTSGVWFPDPRGPTLYAGGGIWLGLNFGI